MRRHLVCLTIVLTALCSASQSDADSAQDITIQGKTFYKDGKPWLPKGIQIEGLNRPLDNYESAAGPAYAKQGRAWYGPAELNAIKDIFRADVIRFQVSQPGLDPQSPIYRPAYVSELLDAFRLARSRGFVVIVSVDAQSENGIPNLPGMPNDSTVRAWQTLAPQLAKDHGIMLELFNEPALSSNPQSQSQWAQSTQAVIDAVRNKGATNILLVDGLLYGRSTNGLFRLVHDTISNRLALAVHPYLSKGGFVTEKQWNDQFGASAHEYPMIATEWNATPTNGCIGPDTPSVAGSLMRYLESLHIGLIGWAIDSKYGKLVKDHTSFQPTDYSTFADCSKTPSVSGGGKLLANYPND
ncbi:MAG: cellulase family glycosylhydrolase [Bradyrhizobium sp.]|nr:cellulase family glycosylhydrolase [Bradyrhizobium sp.]